MFERYYREEKNYLAALGEEFARQHPELAPRLGQAASDPDVERLLDGFAFLTARIRERLDQGNAEIAEQLATVLAPHLVRSVPACSIIQLESRPGSLTGRHRIPRGSEVESVAIRGTRCRYRTTGDVDLVPGRITSTKLEEPRADHGVRQGKLTVRIELDDKGGDAIFEEGGLRLYIAERDRAVATTLLRWLLEKNTDVIVRDVDSGREQALPPGSLRHLSLDDEEALMPWPEASARGFRLLKELLVFPEKFYFLRLDGLEAARHIVTGQAIELVFELDLGSEGRLGAPLSQSALRMHCVPVVNLFDKTLALAQEAPDVFRILRPDGVDPSHVEVFSVDQVVMRETGGQESRVYEDFFSFRHMSTRSGAFYRLRRVTSPLDGRPDVYLSLSSVRDRTPSMRRQILSVDMTCTNRALPAERPEGGTIKVPVPGSFGVAAFENISRISAPIPPALGEDLQWRFMAFLLASQRSLADLEVLKTVLMLHAPKHRSDAHHNRVEALRGTKVHPARRMLHGSPVRGQRTEIEIREQGFEGLGDVYLFGIVLDELFASQVPVNAFHELHVHAVPSGKVLTWRPKAGRRPLL